MKTEGGLEVHAWLEESLYETSKKISNDRLAEVQIKRNAFPRRMERPNPAYQIAESGNLVV